MSAQFEMLWLESCLEGEAAETVQGLGYLDHAYRAAKARLNQKYRRNRRQVQAHIDELRKMRPINADNPRELERFADMVEMTVVSLRKVRHLLTWKEEHCMQLYWKNFLNLYLASTTDGLKKRETWSLLKSCVTTEVAEEAEYQVQASEIKHGLSSAGNARGKSSTKSYFGTTEEKRDRPCKVCNQKHPIWKCDVFKGMELKKKWETAKELGLCYRCMRKGQLIDSCT